MVWGYDMEYAMRTVRAYVHKHNYAWLKIPLYWRREPFRESAGFFFLYSQIQIFSIIKIIYPQKPAQLSFILTLEEKMEQFLFP